MYVGVAGSTAVARQTSAPAAAAGPSTSNLSPANPLAGDDRRPAQNPKLEWRCKCGMVNKPGAYQCAKRGCRVFFCLSCGQLGHQQRFCRQGGQGAAAALPSGAPSAAQVSDADAFRGCGLDLPLGAALLHSD